MHRRILRPLSFRNKQLGGKHAETDCAPFIIQEQRVGWKTRRDRFCSLCHLDFASWVRNAYRQILRPLWFKNSKLRGGRRQIMVIPHTFLPSRGGRVWWHTETNYGHSMSCRPGSIVSNKTQRQIKVILRLVSSERSKFDSIRMMSRYWSFSTFCRFRWQEGSLAEWCFARTKLVSYLYFPFISNKRQVKKVNCDKLISRYLAPIVRKFVKFRAVPEVKRKHCSTISEVPRHDGN